MNAQWHEERSKGIGGSEAAAVLGLSRYKSALQVYLEKIGEIPPQEDNEKMYWGRKLEAIVADEYTVKTGYTVIVSEPVHSIEHPWFRCNPDRLIIREDEKGIGVLECKTASEYVKTEWDGRVPEEYLIQLMHNIGVCDTKWGALAVLIGGSDFRIFEFDRDEELISLIFEKGKDFWFNNVLKRIPPDPTGSSLDVLAKMYPKDNGSLVHINNGIGHDIVNWLTCRDRIKELEERKDESAAKIQSIMGEAQKGIYKAEDNSIYGVSWSHVNGRVSFDAKAFEKDNPELYQKYCRVGNGYRRFNVTKKVGKLTTEERLMIEGGAV